MHGALAIDSAIDQHIKWYALLTQANVETRIARWLRIYKYEMYWPRYTTMVKAARNRRRIRWRSVIPGYLFLALTPEQPLDVRLIESCPMIHRVMRNGSGDVVEINPMDIESIKRIEAALQADEMAAAQNIPFKVSQVVAVKSLLGAHCKILRIADRKRVEVLAILFGAKRQTLVAVSDIEAV
jgi:transcription antitermination factor NusG